MNWKIVATLIVGALLGTACGAQPNAPTMRAGLEEPAEGSNSTDSVATGSATTTPPKTPAGIAVPENK